MNAVDYDYKRFFDLSPDLVCIAGFDGYFKRVNPAVPLLLGYPEEELYGRHIDSFVHEEDREKTSDARRRLREEGTLTQFENRYVTSCGETLWFSWTSQPVPEEKLVFAIARPVTQRKRLEMETHQLLGHLAGANQGLKELNMIASHDLRTPLGSLMGVFELLDPKAVEDPETRELLQILKGTGEKLTESLNRYVDLLSQGMNEEQPRHPSPLNSTLDRVLSSIRSLLQANRVTVTRELSPEADVVYLRPTHLESLFLNLITNAIRYARPGVDPLIRIRTERVGSRVRISVSDNGQGMDMERIGSRLFHLHATFHNHPDSKGVGLYLVHRMVTHAGGEIQVESTPGKGTTFQVTLPTG